MDVCLYFSPLVSTTVDILFSFLPSLLSFFFFSLLVVVGAGSGWRPGTKTGDGCGDVGDSGLGMGHWLVMALPPSHNLVLSPSPCHLAPLATRVPLIPMSPTLLPSSSPLSLSSPPPPSSPSPCSPPHHPLPEPLKATIIAACLALHLVSMRKFPPLPLFAFVISKPCNSSFAQGCGKCPFFNIFLWLMFVIL